MSPRVERILNGEALPAFGGAAIITAVAVYYLASTSPAGAAELGGMHVPDTLSGWSAAVVAALGFAAFLHLALWLFMRPGKSATVVPASLNTTAPLAWAPEAPASDPSEATAWLPGASARPLLRLVIGGL